MQNVIFALLIKNLTFRNVGVILFKRVMLCCDPKLILFGWNEGKWLLGLQTPDLYVYAALRCEWELDRDRLWDEQRSSEGDRAAPRDRRIGSSAVSDVHCAQKPSDEDYAI